MPLPTVVPPEFGQTILTVDRDAVTIGLSFDCHRYTVCALAVVERSGGPLPRAGRRPVRLQNGVVGWYGEHACAANCKGSATLDFERDGVSYTISVKAGTEREAVIIANGLRTER
jgi:hypothetical protein